MPKPDMKMPNMPEDFKPSEVFQRYSRVTQKPGRRMGGRGGGPGGRFAQGGKLDKRTAWRLLKMVFKRYWLPLLVVFAAIILSAQANVRAQLFLKTLIDDYITPLSIKSTPVVDTIVKSIDGMITGDAALAQYPALDAVLPAISEFTVKPTPVLSGLLSAIVSIGLIYMAGLICTWLWNFLMVGVAQGTLKRVRDEMFQHMQTLPIKYFDSRTHGDIMSHFTNDTETMRQMIGQSIPQVFSSLVTVITVFVNMVILNLWLTGFTLLVVFVMMYITKRIGGRAAKYFVAQQATLGALNGFIEEMTNGQKVVKVFCHEDTAKNEFDELNDSLCDQAYNANKLANILMPIMGNIGNMQYVLLAIIGGTLAITGIGGITVGTLVAFMQLSRSFSMPISQVSQQINSVVSAMAGAQRIFRLLDEPSEADEGYVTLVNAEIAKDGSLVESAARTGIWAWKHPHKADGSVTYERVTGDVRMYEVDFAYVEGNNVLNDISLYAEPGQKVAFVGATGAGKTTITNLINRFYDLADGKIRYDGININKIRKPDLRRSLGIVLQDTNLFTGTVMENIRYGKLDATDEDVYRAARLANADDFIRRLPQGYDTMLTANGASLSQGQRQLISIARAAVADPPVMILDEATSSIDTRTESLVSRGMDELMKGRTVFVIAHRLSTVQNSDVIMVLERGRIIERGTHDMLVEQGGQYYQLYTGAFELE